MYEKFFKYIKVFCTINKNIFSLENYKNNQFLKTNLRQAVLNKLNTAKINNINDLVLEYVKKITPISRNFCELEIGVVGISWLPK